MNIQLTNSNTFCFKSGLTKQMRAEMQSCSPKKIENYFAEQGIYADFKNNKVASWCSLQCIKLIQELNKKYNLNLGYPKGVIVENFDRIRTCDKRAFGLTNFAPAYLYKDKDIIIPERTILFDTNNKAWQNIDKMEEEAFTEGISPTNFFLDSILHEFMHVLHEANMLKVIGGHQTLNALTKIQDINLIQRFQQKYSKRIKKYICEYASSNQLEAVACDLTKRIINSLDKENLILKKNPFRSSPYEKKVFLTQKQEPKINEVLKQIWRGNLDV